MSDGLRLAFILAWMSKRPASDELTGPDAKIARVEEDVVSWVEPKPSDTMPTGDWVLTHLKVCNASALKHQQALDAVEWKVPYVRTIWLGEDTVTKKMLMRIDQAIHILTRPNLVAMLGGRCAFSIPASDVEALARGHYCSVTPMLHNLVSREDINSLSAYCEEVDMQLGREVERQTSLAEGFYKTMELLKIKASWPSGGQVILRCMKPDGIVSGDRPHVKINFNPTINWQEHARSLLSSFLVIYGCKLAGAKGNVIED